MKRTTLMTILAMSLALGASRADTPAGTNKPEEHQSLAKWIRVGAEGVTAGNDTDERQSVRLTSLGNADREKPLILMAFGGCQTCPPLAAAIHSKAGRRVARFVWFADRSLNRRPTL